MVFGTSGAPGDSGAPKLIPGLIIGGYRGGVSNMERIMKPGMPGVIGMPGVNPAPFGNVMGGSAIRPGGTPCGGAKRVPASGDGRGSAVAEVAGGVTAETDGIGAADAASTGHPSAASTTQAARRSIP